MKDDQAKKKDWGEQLFYLNVFESETFQNIQALG